MKRGISLLLALAGLICGNWSLAITAEVSNENLIPNPGFEIVGDKRLTDGWWTIGEKLESLLIEVDSTVKLSGTNSVHFRFDPVGGPHAGTEAIVGMQLDPMFREGSVYTFSCHLKTKDVHRACLELYEYPAPFPPGTIHRSPELQGTHDWTRLSITFTARVDIVSIQIRCMAMTDPAKRGGEVWFDNCKIEAGSTPTAFTDDWVKEYYGLTSYLAYFPLRFDYEVNTAAVSPHVAPSVSGAEDPMPVTFAMYWSNLREAVELAQRSNLRVGTAALNTGGKRDKTSKMHEGCALRFREQLASNPKVLVMDGGAWQNLITEDRARIEERVRQGMGIVFHELIPGVVIERVKELLNRCQQNPGDAPTSYRLGKGCIVPLYLPKQTANIFLRENRYDQVVRAIYLAAQRPVGDVDVKIATAQLESGQPWRVEAALTNSAAATPVRARFRIYPNQSGPQGSLTFSPLPVVQEQKVPYKDAAVVEMEILPAGEYILETSILAADEHVIAWKLQAITADAPLRIRELTSSNPVLEPGKACSVEMRLENKSEGPQDVNLRLRLADTNGRLLAEPGSISLRLPKGASATNILVTARPSSTPMAKLELDLIEQDIALDHRTLALSAEPLLREPDYRFGFYADHVDGCRQIGADTHAGLEGPDWGFRIFPWLDVMPAAEGMVHGPEDSVTNPDTIKQAGALLVDGLRKLLPFRTVGVMVIDEWEHKFRESPHHLAYFKRYLQQTYPTIAALNTSWGTTLKSFDEVNFAQCSTMAIRDSKISPVAWADLQTAMEHAVADYVAALNAATRTVDPDVRLGFSGTRETKATNGLDWWLLMQQSGVVATYRGVHTRFEESFGKPDTRIYQWSYPTGQKDVPIALYDPWRDMFRQRDGYLHYGGRFSPLFLPDFTPDPVALVLEKEIEEIRRGPARLVRGARSEDFGIAVLYSIASYHASQLPQLMGKGGDFMNDILYSTDSVLADAGLGSHFVSYEELAAGKVTRKDFKVLLLPYAQALSAAEAQAIRAFATAGGIVIADIRPGVYDEHCKKLPSGQLDQLFGIGPVTDRGLTMSEAVVKVANSGEAQVLAGEPDLRATGADTLARVELKDGTKAPAVLVNSVGKGKAILLNFAFPAYRTYRPGGIGGEVGTEQDSGRTINVRELIGGLLAEHAGIKPVAHLTTSTGGDLRAVSLFTYTDGAAHYIGLLPPRKGDRPGVMQTGSARLTLNEKAHVYDVRAGKYLGHVDALDRTVQEAHAQLLALLPYTVKSLAVDTSKSAEAGGTIKLKVQIRTEGGQPGRHVILVRLRRPDGTEQRYDRFTFEASNGRGETTIPLALNDPAGKWQVMVTEAATGVNTETVVLVNDRRSTATIKQARQTTR